MRSQIAALIATFLLSLFGMAGLGCGNDDTREAGQKLEKGARKGAKEAGKAAESAGDAAEDATDGK